MWYAYTNSGVCIAMRDVDAIIETLNVKNIFTVGFWYSAGSAEESVSGINWATILFIAGMMIMVEGMAKAGFFRWLCMQLARLVNYKPVPLFIVFMIMSSVLAMFIDSITVILFLAAVTVELGKLLKSIRFVEYCRKYSARIWVARRLCAATAEHHYRNITGVLLC